VAAQGNTQQDFRHICQYSFNQTGTIQIVAIQSNSPTVGLD
jgi:hypothetical protein